MLQDYVAYVENSTFRVLQARSAKQRSQLIDPCQSTAMDLISIRSFFEDRELPAPDMSCYTQFIGTSTFKNESSPFSAEKLYESMRRRMLSLYFHRNTIVDSLISDWSEPDTGFDYAYSYVSTKCNMNYASVFRVGPNWYIGTSLTNPGHTRHVPLFKRHILTEYLHSCNRSRLQALQFSARKLPEGNGTHIIFRNTTTTLTSVSGALAPYGFRPEYPDNNIAMVTALEKSKSSIQQVDDALAPSSLVLLLLPLALNLMPIALLADVESFAMLLYMLVSDVVTVIPLGIKGVELIVIGRQRHISAGIRFTGSELGIRSHSAGKEMWAAECRARDSVLTIGVVFLVLALVFIGIGIALEFIAKYFLDKRNIIYAGTKIENEPFFPAEVALGWQPRGLVNNFSVGARLAGATIDSIADLDYVH